VQRAGHGDSLEVLRPKPRADHAERPLEAPETTGKSLEVQFSRASAFGSTPGFVLHDGPRLLGSLQLLYDTVTAAVTERLGYSVPYRPAVLPGCEQPQALQTRSYPTRSAMHAGQCISERGNSL
jgi:hypothetical protein